MSISSLQSRKCRPKTTSGCNTASIHERPGGDDGKKIHVAQVVSPGGHARCSTGEAKECSRDETCVHALEMTCDS